MAIYRNVQIDGTLYTRHEIITVEHNVASGITQVGVESTGDYNPITTFYAKDIDFGITLEETYEWIGSLPAFAEYVDPEASLIDELASMLDDEQAVTVPQAYREWQPDTAYAIGDRRRYEDVLYKCISPHTSGEAYPPSTAVSLWARIIASDDPGQPLPWVQPDSTNPYMKGDRVTYDGQVWESDYDNNVWEPGVAGWHVVEVA